MLLSLVRSSSQHLCSIIFSFESKKITDFFYSLPLFCATRGASSARANCWSWMMEVARVCREYLRQGAALDVPVFFQWWKRCENYAFVKEKLGDPFTQPATPAPGKKPRKRVQDRAARRSPYPGGFHGSTLFGERGLTLLHVALKHKVPDPVTLAIAEEWPDAAKVKNEHGNTPLHLGLWNSSTKLSVSEKVLVKLIELCPAAVEVKAHNDDGPMSTLIAALSVKDLPPAVVLAILAACPQMAKELKPFNNDTPLHVALETLRGDHYRANSIANILLPAVPKDARDSEKEAAGNALEPASDAIILALIALWPDSVKQVPLDNNENSHFSTPMHYAMVYGASVPVVKAMIDACPEALAIPELESGHLPLHDALESKTTTEAATLLVLDAYPLAANPPAAGGGLAEPALHTAFQNTDRNTEAVVRAIAAAAPEMCQSVGYRGNDDDDASETILHMAVKGTPSNQMVQLAVELWPGAVGMKTRVQTGLGRFDGVTYGGNTPLHELALWNEERQDYVTAADFRSKNDICYTLAGAGASVTARNAAGDTADEASHKSVFYGKPSEGAAEGNRHLRATLHEIEMYTSLPHLGLMHFRDWTSVSHAWCTPSAKLTALTVLLVGCSFKRLDSEWKLPRLPMDCWYRILNMIPRHELRMGNFTAESELAAEAQYTAILASGTAKKSSTSVVTSIALMN